MNSVVRRIAAFALAAPLLLTGAAAAAADGPGGGTSASDLATTSQGAGTSASGRAAASADARPSSATTGRAAPTTSASSAVGTSFTAVSATAPSFDLEEQTLTIPAVPGVRYVDLDGLYFEPGIHDAYAWEYVVAIPLPGYSLTGAHEWDISFVQDNPRATPVVGKAPTFDVAKRTYSIPTVPGIEYIDLLYGDSVAPGVHTMPKGESWAGFFLEGQRGFEVLGIASVAATYAPLRGYQLIEPTFDLAKGTYTIPSDPRVQYYVDDEPVKPGTYRGAGTVQVWFEIIDETSAYHWTDTEWEVTYPAASASPFLDVKPGVQHYDAMVWMSTSGTSTGWKVPGGYEYRPLAPVNRDAMAAFLYRQAGSPAVTLPATSPFTDMKPRDQHYKAVVWAYQQGITRGWEMTDGTRQFRPVQPIARDAMAAFLYRFAEEPAYTMPKGSCFKDVARSQLYAKEMCWMKSEGISQGWSDGTYRPLEPVKRDAMAAFLQRYDAKF